MLPMSTTRPRPSWSGGGSCRPPSSGCSCIASTRRIADQRSTTTAARWLQGVGRYPRARRSCHRLLQRAQVAGRHGAWDAQDRRPHHLRTAPLADLDTAARRATPTRTKLGLLGHRGLDALRRASPRRRVRLSQSRTATGTYRLRGAVSDQTPGTRLDLAWEARVDPDPGQPTDATWTVLADPDGNEFCVLSARVR